MGLQWTLSETSDARQRKLTVEDVFAMVEAGILNEDERVELIDGVLVEMSPKNNRHEVFKVYIHNELVRLLSPEYLVAVETTLRLSETTYVEPDMVVFARSTGIPGLNGEMAELVIEVADTSLFYDMCDKVEIYARHGVREYWVVNTQADEVIVHRAPAEGAYSDVQTVPTTAKISPGFRPDLEIVLANMLD